MLIADILKTKGSQVISIGPDADLAAAARTLAQHRIGAVLVREPRGTVLGILSERDIVRGLATSGENTLRLLAGQLMTRDLVTATPATSVAAALGLMTDRRCRHLPVVLGGELVGLVSIGDLVKARIEEAEAEAAVLKHYVTSGG